MARQWSNGSLGSQSQFSICVCGLEYQILTLTGSLVKYENIRTWFLNSGQRNPALSCNLGQRQSRCEEPRRDGLSLGNLSTHQISPRKLQSCLGLLFKDAVWPLVVCVILLRRISAEEPPSAKSSQYLSVVSLALYYYPLSLQRLFLLEANLSITVH